MSYPDFIIARCNPDFTIACCELIKSRYDSFKLFLHDGFRAIQTDYLKQSFEFYKNANFDYETFNEFVEFLKANKDIDYYIEYGDYNKDPNKMAIPFIRVYISPKNGFIETITTVTTRLKF